ERMEPGGASEHHPVLRVRTPQRAQRRDCGEEISEPERAQHEKGRTEISRSGSSAVVQGHDVSPDGQTTSSRTSQPFGCCSANTTARATSPGLFITMPAGGLYSAGRSSKKLVCMPPGTSNVTPTRPASSAASARVKPTTPNLLAQ